MKNKARVIKLSIMLIVTFITLIMVTFAWFIAIDKTDPIIIESGTLRVKADLYIHNDINNNGQVDEGEYILADKPISIVNVVPGSVFHFKLEIENLGSVPGNLTIDIIGIEYSDEEKMGSLFEVEFIDPKNELDLITKPISGEEINLFIDKRIEKSSIFTFHFQIVSGQNINDEIAGHWLKLSSFLITLNQIRPE